MAPFETLLALDGYDHGLMAPSQISSADAIVLVDFAAAPTVLQFSLARHQAVSTLQALVVLASAPAGLSRKLESCTSPLGGVASKMADHYYSRALQNSAAEVLDYLLVALADLAVAMVDAEMALANFVVPRAISLVVVAVAAAAAAAAAVVVVVVGSALFRSGPVVAVPVGVSAKVPAVDAAMNVTRTPDGLLHHLQSHHLRFLGLGSSPLRRAAPLTFHPRQGDEDMTWSGALCLRPSPFPFS
jgi:hypothetical protein